MHAIGFSRPLRFERVIEVNGASLLLSYKVVSVGPEPLSFLYAWHPLFAVEAGDRVVLPAEVADVHALLLSGRGAWTREESSALACASERKRFERPECGPWRLTTRRLR